MFTSFFGSQKEECQDLELGLDIYNSCTFQKYAFIQILFFIASLIFLIFI